MIKPKKRVIICDYDNPKKYTFPSFGFGSSEKRVWHFAKTVSELDEFEVIITGPLWLPEYVPNAKYFPKRLNGGSCKEFLDTFGRCDYLFAGHEYFDKDEWVDVFEKCADTLISYQLHPYQYKKISFDGKKKILFCYSDQMLNTCKEQKPNYAVEAARLLNLNLWILGKTIYQPDYFEKHKKDFNSSHVKMLGVKFGEEKMNIISKAACAIYTIDKNYSEAGAGVLGEILSSGVPIAGMTWVGDDAIVEAVNHKDLGKVINANNISESKIPEELSAAVRYCLKLKRKQVYSLGKKKYDPHMLVRNIFKIIENRRK
jgi:glycosyltransferase involved in cell wall biosynthesis